jgi:alpha-glucosidase
MRFNQVPVFLGLATSAFSSSFVQRKASSDDCPGYTASNVQDSGSRVTADLTLAGTICSVYGTDLVDLKLEVDYESGKQS